MDVHILRALSDNLIYVVPYGRTAFVVDPGAAAPVLAEIQRIGCHLSHILLTHHHVDHVGGVVELCARQSCVVVAARSRRMPRIDVVVKDGDELTVAGRRVRALSMCGHTRDDMVYYLPDDRIAFTGDLLFVGGCGRLLEEGPETMWESLRRLRELPDDTQIYCGHDYTAENLAFALSLEPQNADMRKRLSEVRQQAARGEPTVPSLMGIEKKINPFLRADSEAMARAVHGDVSNPAAVFAELRRRKDRW